MSFRMGVARGDRYWEGAFCNPGSLGSVLLGQGLKGGSSHDLVALVAWRVEPVSFPSPRGVLAIPHQMCEGSLELDVCYPVCARPVGLYDQTHPLMVC